MTSVSPTGVVQRTGAREWRALAVLTLAVTLLAIDGTVLALAVPSLTAALNPTPTQILWIGDIYSFALAGLLITMGNVADRVGRKRLLLIGSVGFGIASALAAFAPNAELLIVARVLLGISGATLMPSTLSLVRNIFEDAKQRTTAIAIWSAGATAGAALGPLVGGLLLENFWWGSVFLINIPVMVIILIAGAILLPESKSPQRVPIDLLSALLSAAAIIPVVYLVKSVASGEFTPTAAVVGAVGILAGVWFVRRQKRLAHPMVDVALFRNPAFSGAVVANTIAIFAFSGLLFFFSQYLQLVRGFSPILAGVAELPTTVASIVVIVFIGAIVGRLGRGRAIGIGLAGAGAGLAFLAVAEGLPSYLWIAIALALIGFGIGIAMTVSVDAVMSAVPKERAGAASSISETAYELGIALGIAVLGSLHAGIYRASTAGLITDSSLELDATGTLAAADRSLRADGSADALNLLEQLQHGFTTAMQYTSVIAAILVFTGAIIAWFLIPSSRTRADIAH